MPDAVNALHRFCGISPATVLAIPRSDSAGVGVRMRARELESLLNILNMSSARESRHPTNKIRVPDGVLLLSGRGFNVRLETISERTGDLRKTKGRAWARSVGPGPQNTDPHQNERIMGA